MQIPFGALCKTVLAWNSFSLATIGVCVFCALASVGALFLQGGVYMKHRVIILATLLLISVFAFSLSACNSNDDSSNTGGNTNTVNTVAADSLVFGYNVDKNALTNFFIENGEKQNQNKQEYVVSNNLATIYYYPQTNKFNIFRQITKNSILEEAALTYRYEWMCGIEISLYDLLFRLMV